MGPRMRLRIVLAGMLLALALAPAASYAQQTAKTTATPVAAVAPGALTPDTARSFIDKLGQRTLAVLQSQSTPAPQRGAELGRILLDGIDFDVVAMQTLGRYGRKPDSKDFHEFATLFAAHVIDLAIEKFGSLPVQSYTIGSVNSYPNGDIMVNTAVMPGGGQTLNTGWRVRSTPAGYKIVDISVDGYSMVTHFANQFSDWLSKAGLEGMVTKLRGQTRNSPSLALVRAHRP